MAKISGQNIWDELEELQPHKRKKEHVFAEINAVGVTVKSWGGGSHTKCIGEVKRV